MKSLRRLLVRHNWSLMNRLVRLWVGLSCEQRNEGHIKTLNGGGGDSLSCFFERNVMSSNNEASFYVLGSSSAYSDEDLTPPQLARIDVAVTDKNSAFDVIRPPALFRFLLRRRRGRKIHLNLMVPFLP